MSAAEGINVTAEFWRGRVDFGSPPFAAQSAVLNTSVCNTEHGPVVLVAVHGDRLSNTVLVLTPDVAQAIAAKLAGTAAQALSLKGKP